MGSGPRSRSRSEAARSPCPRGGRRGLPAAGRSDPAAGRSPSAEVTAAAAAEAGGRRQRARPPGPALSRPPTALSRVAAAFATLVDRECARLDDRPLIALPLAPPLVVLKHCSVSGHDSPWPERANPHSQMG